MTTILHLAAVAGVCLGLCVFVLLAASSYVVRRLDQEIADEAAGAPHIREQHPGGDVHARPLTPLHRSVMKRTVRRGRLG